MLSLDKITKHRHFRLVSAFIIVGTMMFFLSNFFVQQSVVKNATVEQFLSPSAGATMSTGTLTVSAKFYPALAPQGTWPVARAYRVLVEEVLVGGTLIRVETPRDIFDETVAVPESDAPFTIIKYVPITNNLRHIITIYLLTYDSYIDWLRESDGTVPPYVPPGGDALPFSITSPSSGENVYYNTINFYVETQAPPAEEITAGATTPELGEGHISPSFGLLSVLLALPVLLKIKQKRNNKND